MSQRADEAQEEEPVQEMEQELEAKGGEGEEEGEGICRVLHHRHACLAHARVVTGEQQQAEGVEEQVAGWGAAVEEGEVEEVVASQAAALSQRSFTKRT